MKPVAIALFAVLALSFIPFLAGQQAQALSAITFTSKGTVTTTSTTQWQRVYENSTDSIILLDANNTHVQKSQYSVAGETVTTATAALDGAASFFTTPTNAAASSDGGYVVFTEDYTTNTGWTQVGTLVTVDSGVADKVAWENAQDGTDRRVHKSLGMNLSNTGWAAEFEFRRTVDASAAHHIFQLTSTTGNIATDTAMDGIIVMFDDGANCSTTGHLFLLARDGASLSTISGCGLEVGALSTDYYVRLERLNATAMRLSAYSDAARTTHVTGSPMTASIASTVTDLDVMQHGVIPTASNSFTLTATMDNTVIKEPPSTDNMIDDNTTTYWSNGVDSESGGYVYFDMASNDTKQGSIKVNHGSLTQIPQSIDVYVSNDTASWGAVIDTITLTQATGDQTHDFTDTYVTGRYIKLQVNTWGSAVRWQLNEIDIGIVEGASSAIFNSHVESDSKHFAIGRNATAGVNIVASFNTNNLAIIDNANLASTLTPKDIAQSTTKIYVALIDGSNNLSLGIMNRDFSSYSEVALGDAMLAGGFVHMAVYDGSPDTVYVYYSDSATVIKVAKYTSSASILGTTITQASNADFAAVQLTSKVLVQTNSRFYEHTVSSDTITQIHGNTFLTYYPQPFDINSSARTFKSAAVYVANATYATNYTPNTGSSARTGVFIDVVNTGGSGTIETFNPAKYYYASQNDLTVEATATTWTIKELGITEQVQVTGYSEEVGIDLAENTTAILALDVVTLNCDNGNYLIEIQYFAVGSDADCAEWWTFDESSGTTPRKLHYVTSGELVHAMEYTGYTVQLSVGNPTLYTLTTIYDGQDVDTGAFDSGGNTNQEFLFNQCYTLQVVEESTGNTLQTGLICAGNIDPITISLSGIVVPENWLQSTWSHNIQRNYTTNSVLFTFQKSVSPYNGSLYVTDNFVDSEATFTNWYNFTDVTGISVANVTGTTSNMTLYFTLYENDIPVIFAVSNAQEVLDNPFSEENWGLIFGLPLAFIFPILTAAMFPKSLAYFGSIVTVAVIGIMSIFGFITLPDWYWAITMPLVAFAVFVGYKR